MLLLWSAASFKTHFCKTCRRFDYNTSVVAGQQPDQTGRLQISRFQNSAARLVLKKRDRDLIAPLLNELHWPPVQFFYKYKVATCVPSLRQYTVILLLIAALHTSSTYQVSCILRSSRKKLLEFLNVICNFCVSALSLSLFYFSGIFCLSVWNFPILGVIWT